VNSQTTINIIEIITRSILAQSKPGSTEMNIIQQVHELHVNSHWETAEYQSSGKRMLKISFVNENGEVLFGGRGTWSSSVVGKQTLAYQYLQEKMVKDAENETNDATLSLE